MSGPTAIVPRCEVCHQASTAKYKESYLCDEHAAKWQRHDALMADLAATLAAWSEKHEIDERETARLCDEMVDLFLATIGDNLEVEGREV